MLRDDVAARDRRLTRSTLSTRSRADDPPRALRRWKRQQLVRIAGRDLLGIADLRDVGAELADLAEACLEVAVAVAAPPSAVRRDRDGQARRARAELLERRRRDVRPRGRQSGSRARRTCRARDDDVSRTPDGIVFRTDADLRPEGRSGALSRTLEGFEAYWERWAQNWELQALIKARPGRRRSTTLGRDVHRARRAVRVARRRSIPMPSARSAR